MNSTTLNDIINYVSNLNPKMQKNQITLAVETFFKELSLGLICGDSFQIKGLCSFNIKENSPRSIYNPKLKKQINIPVRRKLNFKISKKILKDLNSNKKHIHDN